MVERALVPDSLVKRFFEAYVVDQPDLCLTVKTAEQCSVNIDGPFTLSTYKWQEWRPAPEGEKPRSEEIVLQPRQAVTRSRGESSVHLHVAWEQIKWVRLQYLTPKDLPLIDLRVRIAFFAEAPPPDKRVAELFWFYTNEKHPLVEQLPKNGSSGFSDPKEVAALAEQLP